MFSFLLLFICCLVCAPTAVITCPTEYFTTLHSHAAPPAAPRKRYSHTTPSTTVVLSSTGAGNAHFILNRVADLHPSVRVRPTLDVGSKSVANAEFILNHSKVIHQKNNQQNTDSTQSNDNSQQQQQQQSPTNGKNTENGTQDDNDDLSDEKKRPPILIIAVSVGAAAVVLLVAIIIIHWRYCRRSSSASEDSDSLYYKFDYNATSLASMRSAGANDDNKYGTSPYMEDEEMGGGYGRKISRKNKNSSNPNASFISTDDAIAAPRIDEDEVPSSGVAFLDTYGHPIAEPIAK